MVPNFIPGAEAMLVNIPYNRESVKKYAETWALKRNPKYVDFEAMGGDCTNFASQCIFAGCNIMNYTPVTGWYYLSGYNRTASWSGVDFLHNFLTANQSVGPYGTVTDVSKAEIGDIIQLGDSSYHFYHSPVVVGFESQEILLAAHSFDVYGKPLSAYQYYVTRCLHIQGIRKYG
jgi:hypothetical protein